MDIANNLRCLTQILLLQGRFKGEALSLPVRVGPDTMPAELCLSDEEEEDEE